MYWSVTRELCLLLADQYARLATVRDVAAASRIDAAIVRLFLEPLAAWVSQLAASAAESEFARLLPAEL